MITSEELAYMRAAINDLLPDTCNILSRTVTVDGQGGVIETWGTAYPSVACRLDQIRAKEIIAGAALQSSARWILTLPYDTTITTASRVEHRGLTYAVTTMDNDKSWLASVRCEVEIL